MLLGIACCMVLTSMNTLNAQTNVAIDAFATVATNASMNVFVTLTPSNISEGVVVEMRCFQGIGEAVFLPSGCTSTNIQQSSMLTVKGSILSTMANNVVMEAKIGAIVLATNIFTVVDTNKISFAQARVIADQAIVGAAEPEAGAPVTVELTRGNSEYLVTFGSSPVADVLKGDFCARVRIATVSGDVIGGVEVAP